MNRKILGIILIILVGLLSSCDAPQNVDKIAPSISSGCGVIQQQDNCNVEGGLQICIAQPEL